MGGYIQKQEDDNFTCCHVCFIANKTLLHVLVAIIVKGVTLH